MLPPRNKFYPAAVQKAGCFMDSRYLTHPQRLLQMAFPAEKRTLPRRIYAVLR
jgi:hypothetical protein